MTMTESTTPNSIDEQGRFKVTNLNGGKSRMELSNQWYRRPADERFLDLNSLRDAVKARADASKTHTLKTKNLLVTAPEPETLEDTHIMKIMLPGDDEPVEPTHWSFGQIAQLAGAGSAASYFRKQPSQLVAPMLNYGLRHIRAIEEVKLYARPGTDLRAATGPDYGRIYDHELVAAVQQIAGNGVGDTRWKIPGVMDWRTMIYDPNVPPSAETTTLYASDRDVFMFLVDDRNPIVVGKARDGQDDIMFRGFYFSNSEVGSGAAKIAMFYLRGLCENRIMWGVEGFEELSIRHSKNAPARFIAEAKPALLEMAERSDTKLRDAVNRAKSAKVATDEETGLEFLRKHSLSATQAQKVLDLVAKEEGQPARTVWDMANGITAMARSETHQDQRVAMERVAGRMLDKVA